MNTANAPLSMHHLSRLLAIVAAAIGLSSCMMGPDYHQASADIPLQFKEGATVWTRTDLTPALPSPHWWLAYHDDLLTALMNKSLAANQSIVAAEANYRLAQATLRADQASLAPTVTLDSSAARGVSQVATATGSSSTGTRNTLSVSAAASWEPDLWGQVRRQIESGKASMQAADATLAGQQLSIVSSLAVDYFELRQLDTDIALLQQQVQINTRLLRIQEQAFAQGTASQDDVLTTQNNLAATITSGETLKISREQMEHAIAVLAGQAPAEFSIAPQPDYVFVHLPIPPSLPAALLRRRPDIVSAERTAAAANARIGVAKAAFFPSLDLSAQGGFEHNSLSHLFSLPNRIWSLGPELAATVFDGGARSAAVREAQATYDQDVANYRQTILSALQNVEDSLSSVQHQRVQETTLALTAQRNQALFKSKEIQIKAGTASGQNLLSQQLALITAQQNLKDSQSALAQSEIGLIKNLGGGWQADTP